MNTIDVLPIFHSSTTMKLVKLDDGRKIFPSITFDEMIKIANSDEWEFDKDQISLSILKFIDPTVSDEALNYDRTTENKLLRYEEINEPIIKEVYKVNIGYSTEHSIILFGDYTVYTNEEEGKIGTKKVSELNKGDAILSKIFGNVISALSILDITKIGDYELEKYIRLYPDEGDIISVGSDSVEIFVN